MRAHNQSINASCVRRCPRLKIFWDFSCQELFLSSKSQKIQRLLDFNSAVEIYLKHATDGLDRGEVWNPAIFRQSLQIRMFFSTQFLKYFLPIKGVSLLFPTFFCEIKYHIIHISFHNWETPTREDGFSRKMEPDGAVKVTLRVSRGSWDFSFSSLCVLNIFEKPFDLPVATPQKTNMTRLRKATTESGRKLFPNRLNYTRISWKNQENRRKNRKKTGKKTGEKQEKNRKKTEKNRKTGEKNRKKTGKHRWGCVYGRKSYAFWSLMLRRFIIR